MPLPQEHSPESRIGRTIGPYRIEQFVGRGGMGEVYRARDERLRRDVAIKTLPAGVAARDEARIRFVRETRLASRVVHPYVATVFDVIEDDDDLLLVMEFIDGISLQELLIERSPERREATAWAVEIAEALAAIHRADLVHRDLKPGNIMITPDGHVKVMDFGVARAMTVPKSVASQADTVDRTLTGQGIGVGTVKYMSPEQVRGQIADHRSDQFAFGTVLYEMITGTHPFERASVIDTASAITRDRPGGGAVPKTLQESGALRRVVLKLLEKDPADRYPSTDAMLADLRAVLHGEEPSGIGWGLPRRYRRRLLLVASAFGLGVLTFWGIQEIRNRGDKMGAPSRPMIAVLPFIDETGDDAPARGPMLASVLAGSLADHGNLRTLRTDRVDEILAVLPGNTSRSAQVDAIQRVASVDWVLAGTVYREGTTYLASVDISSPRRVADRAFTVRAGAPLDLVDSLFSRLQRELAPGEPEVEPPAGKAADVPEAARAELFQARRALREYRPSDAIAFAESALAIDQRFAEAELVRGQALALAGFGRKAEESARRVVDLVTGAGARAPERLVLEGRVLRATLAHDGTAREAALSALAERFPDDPEVAERRAKVLLDLARTQDALVEADRAVRLDPGDPRPQLLRAEVLSALDRAEEARAALDLAARMFTEFGSERGRAAVSEGVGRAAWKRGDHEGSIGAYLEAAATFRRTGETARAARAESDAARLYLVQGRLVEAEKGFLAAAQSFRLTGLHREALANLNALGAQRFVRGEYEAAERLLRDAVQGARALENPWLDVDPTINLASLLVYTNRPDEGGALAEEAAVSARRIGDVEREGKALSLHADSAFQRGRIREARDAYAEIVRIQEAHGSRGEALVWALLGVAETEEAAGRLSAAAAASGRAVTIARQAALRTPLGYGALHHGRILGQLGQWVEADSALEEARRQVGSGGERMEDLDRRIDHASGLMSLMRGRWDEAARRLLPLSADASTAVSIRLPALVAHARATLECGRPDEAERDARAVLGDPRARVTDALAARVELARASAQLGHPAVAASEARRCLETASTLDLALPEAEAAAILLSLPRESRAESDDELRLRRRTASDRVLSGIAPDRRSSFRERRDLAAALAMTE